MEIQNRPNEYWIHLFIDSLTGVATGESQAELTAWRNASDANEHLFSEMKKIWDSLSLSDYDEQFDAERAYQLFRERVKAETKRIIPGWIRYVAAVFLGIALASTTMYFGMKQAGKTEMCVRHTVFNHNGVQKIVLPDQSVAWLNEHSRISYPETFEGDKRTVRLEGTAFLEIRKNAEQPFIVQTETVDIQVTGTSFHVQDDAEMASVTLISGSVTVCVKDGTGQIAATTRLQPGQQACVDKLDRQFAVTNIDTTGYVLWKDGTFRFTDEPLEIIAKQLSLHFGVNIKVAPGLRKKRFTGRVTPDHRICDVMEIINKSNPVKYRTEKEAIYISEK
ncbi:MAG: FecR domain-containing protein [Tannerella sp.]|jgi:ferric-dicitrate binding protein FerR (iron transport regulator)|nr:FecR domain-containing protein [Tannerella sp.]